MNWTVNEGQPLTAVQKRQAFANLRKVQSSTGKSAEEQKEINMQFGSGDSIMIPQIYDFVNKYHEFSWDHENSSKEV